LANADCTLFPKSFKLEGFPEKLLNAENAGAAEVSSASFASTALKAFVGRLFA